MNRTVKRVQIIDDEIVILMAVSRAHRHKPVDIIPASNIDQALEQMDIFAFNLFILDLDIKGCCGFQLLEQMTRRFPEIPVILMTTQDIQSLALMNKINKIRSQCCWHLLEKPFDYKKLVGFIDRALQVSEFENVPSCQHEGFAGLEKRSCRRFSRCEQINISRPSVSDSSSVSPAFCARLADISVGGLGVATRKALMSGEVVHFDEKFMHQSGTVVWSRPQKGQIHKSGIRFI
ncbi:response regulator [uncultured Desulfuromusa sp.]|uniref:response regulator n=1 Tax=uncultured Desulfuromusa sp. TaxID=219183 RepID=UPI002AA72D99|nr:response regulator [uncultured Desulfuromusa sp.]